MATSARAATAPSQNLFGAPSSTQTAKPTPRAGKAAGGKTTAGQPAAPANVKVTPAAPTSTATTATTPATEPSRGTSGALIIALALGILLLGGIAFVIVRDARSVAPVVEGAIAGGTRNPEGKLRKRRAQAKAARRQRKRHRTR